MSNTRELALPSIPGYTLTEQLYVGQRTAVYRAVSEEALVTLSPEDLYPEDSPEDSHSVVIKVLNSPYPSFSDLVRFRNQYIITKNLPIRQIVKPLALIPWQHRYALVMEDVGGSVALSAYLQEQGSLSVDQGLIVALQLATILHQLSQHRVVHKDIKPANILIQPDTLKIWLIDFSLASLLPKETQTTVPPKDLEGTLAYIAPEQTGRMNRGIDYRADFYGLGVTLYEAFTGHLPFTSDDPLELIHCHLTQQPVPLHEGRRQKAEGRRQKVEGGRQKAEGRIQNSKLKTQNSKLPHSLTPPLPNSPTPPLPNSLSDIVLKLMAKNAEDRYQSALGLKHDLQHCLSQWQETGEIAPFELGLEDRCDRFLIPEKLYGRDAEIQTLLAAFERVSTGSAELMLVAGFSGIGKTAVVNEVHKPIVRQRGYFIKGKFDQFNRNIPFSAFVQAFRSLMGQLLSESDAQLHQWKVQILQAVGENAHVLIDVIPELEHLLGPQPPAPQLEGSAAQNRFHRLFQKFIVVFTTPKHPLVLFLDDLQWADSASLNLISVLMGSGETRHLLLLGAYRDNEVFPAHPLMLTLGDLEQRQASLSTITLAPLANSHINQLVAETLRCSLDLAQPLTNLVYQKTHGNPFFTTQFLIGLYEDTLITFNLNLGYWECDLVQVHNAALTDDVVEFMARRLQKLPKITQQVLTLAACIGNQFDLETLAVVCEIHQDEVAADLWTALQEGLILPTSAAYKFFQGEIDEAVPETLAVGYRFLHDRIQQAAYTLIPERQKQTTHYRIGQRLLESLPPNKQEDRIFELVGHLNYGLDTLSQQDERDALARLNLSACYKAKRATAYEAGWQYVQTGLSLLGEKSWQQQYGIRLALSELAVEFAALCGNWQDMDRWVAEVIANSHSLMEQATVYRIQIKANISRHRMAEAIAIALTFLQKLGITLPEQPTEVDIEAAIAHVRDLMADRPVTDLLHLPAMTDPEKIAIVQVAQSIFPATHISNPPLFPLLVSLSAALSIQYGNIAASAQAYACYGLLLSVGSTPDVITGVTFGQLSLQLIDQLADQTAKPEVLLIAGLFLFHRTSPLQATLPLLQAGYISGLETGNYEFAGYNAYNICFNSFLCGSSLETLATEASAYCRSLEQLNQLTTANYTRVCWQTILNLLETVDHPTLLSGDALQEETALRQWQAANDFQALFFFHAHKLMLCFLFGDLKAARTHREASRNYRLAVTGMVTVPVVYFYGALSTLAELPSDAETGQQPEKQPEKQTGQQSEKQTEQQMSATDSFQQMEADLSVLKTWAHYAPMNHQHKCDLIEAEKCRIFGQKLDAIELYDKAIAASKDNGYIQDEGLANELAAKFYLAWGKRKVAAGYLQEAYYCYARWGAKAKINDLEQRYPTFLQPILQSSSARFNPLETLNILGKTTVNQYSVSTSRQSSAIYNDELDFTAILQAAKALTTTVHLDELLQNLGQIILQQSGADRLVLVLPKLSEFSQTQLTWIVTLVATPESIQLGDEPLASQADLPVQLIRYVKNTQEILGADTVETDLPVIDDYLLATCPQSFLCSPLFHRDELTGILYLQSSTTINLIAPNRLNSLNFLFSQAAIALHNAQLYESAALKSRIIEASVNGIAILEADQYIYLNQHHLDLFGYTQEELLGQRWECLYGPEQVQWFYDIACPLLQQQGQWSGETVARRKDGSTFDEEVSLFMLADGKLICICRDISKRVQLEAQRQRAESKLQQSLAQLQASNQELEAFAYSIAHDLRSPLRAINGYSHALMEDYGDRLDDIGHEYFERICANTNRMGDLIDDLLHLAQVSRLELRCEPVNLSGLAQRLLAELQATQPNRSVHITIEADLVVMADPMLMNVVMQNLLDNAWKFSRDRTLTQIEIGVLPPDTPLKGNTLLNPKQMQDFSSPIYFVRDNGVGFDMTYADKLFGIFQRLHGMEEFPGTGIGLVIVKRAIQRHSGAVWATANVNQGATFCFTIPSLRRSPKDPVSV